MRHFPFAIGTAERDAWLTHMRAAMDEAAIPEPARTAMLDYFENAADFLRNREG
jgi:hemoglobin